MKKAFVFAFAVVATIVLLLFFIIHKNASTSKKLEGFEDAPLTISSRSLYFLSPSLQEFDAKVKEMSESLADKNEMLHMKRCFFFPNVSVKFMPIDAVLADIKNVTSYKDILTMTCSFQDLESRIACEVRDFLLELCGSTAASKCKTIPPITVDSTDGPLTCQSPLFTPSSKVPSMTTMTPMPDKCVTKLQGPVYVLISQAPYYKDAKGQFSDITDSAIDATGNYPFINASENSNQALLYFVRIIFGRYDKFKRVASDDLFLSNILPNLDAKSVTKSKHCGIFAKRASNFRTPLGCGNTVKVKQSDSKGATKAAREVEGPYSSACVASDGTLTTFCTLFTLNTKHPSVATLFV